MPLSTRRNMDCGAGRVARDSPRGSWFCSGASSNPMALSLTPFVDMIGERAPCLLLDDCREWGPAGPVHTRGSAHFLVVPLPVRGVTLPFWWLHCPHQCLALWLHLHRASYIVVPLPRRVWEDTLVQAVCWCHLVSCCTHVGFSHGGRIKLDRTRCQFR